MDIVLTENRKFRREAFMEFLYLAGFFGFMMMWMMNQPFGVSPDEQMRYLIPQFIYEHGNLPHGGDPEIRNADWGISYGFTPITSYIISALFMKIASFFSADFMVLLRAARLVNVLFGTATVFIIIRIGKKLFEKPYDWLFIIVASSLPQFIFVNSYVNMDSIALFGAAFLFYTCILGKESGWKTKHVILFAVALSVCLLSYYNTYGLVLCFSIFFVISVIISCQGEKDWWKTLLKKGMLVVLVVFILCGWWFIRNAVLYNGDFLGLTTCNEYGEMYGREDLKPSNIQTPEKQGLSIWEMFRNGWVLVSGWSFFGVFGAMDMLLHFRVYQIYFGLTLIGVIGAFLAIPKLFRRKDEENRKVDDIWFTVCSVLSIFFTIGISAYYSYTNDYQPQGRYILPMMIPFFYFIVTGFVRILKLFHFKPMVNRILCIAGELVYLALMLYSYFFVFAPAYRGMV